MATTTSLALPDDTSRGHVSSAADSHIVEGGHAYTSEIEEGEHFRVVDLHSEQVADFAAWIEGANLGENMCMTYTRVHLMGVPPKTAEPIPNLLSSPASHRLTRLFQHS
ncbi:hypothetical protein LTR91_018460 [Friedmanniomyces endolithicus]|uniref:Uncharacterized protein n=2 Tax=Dothideomycetidae TaxID=451867 RepID=A0AAN6HCJ7_9PEZI|nr:hypothetical protein LTR94_016206 [Friedmanniomyces endolithicus]KAK5146150.1 hypothetical protein LTR32_002224 [Rachicladosporium monterosium]KAK0768480.1 hypothetical protein LTR59_017635 [Friedmanniomyces endolithicus]KAK0787099.1 hypothetical protein LTR38_011760 [Friedmanniomyces endolithicus]KAK0794517.1 hypothetical protein LTR75_010825 [Friedmanniomyces endolithicus]